MAETPLIHNLEALLFVATEPLSVAQLAGAAGAGPDDTARALADLQKQLSTTGLRLSQLNGTYRLVTAPETAATVRGFLRAESKAELSRAALETLAIVAYRGPLTRSQIETLRGVSSETMLRNLLGRGLIVEAGRSREPGRPLQYAISHSFLQHFGLTSPTDLPPIPEEVGEPHAN
ncbi:MAG: scpB [Patescibacteria group bacterium]|nr:scpB [Patescibacteria group bacterium]